MDIDFIKNEDGTITWSPTLTKYTEIASGKRMTADEFNRLMLGTIKQSNHTAESLAEFLEDYNTYRPGAVIIAEAVNNEIVVKETDASAKPTISILDGNNGYYFEFNNIKGEQGEVGPQGDKGDKGDKGDTGATGPAGAQGPQGVGIPSGGMAGQILTKTASGTAWEDAPSSGNSTSYMSLMESSGIYWDSGEDYNGYFLIPKGYTNYTFYNSHGYIHLTSTMMTGGTISFSYNGVFGLKILTNPYYDETGLLQDFYAVRGWNMMYDEYAPGMNGTILKME